MMFRLAGAVLLCSAAAWGAEWQPLERQCAVEIEQQAGCTTACVNRTWPEVARCVKARLSYRLPEPKFEECVRRIEKARAASRACELCGDPTAEAITCAGG